MSALARWFKSQGYAVSGSDSQQSPITDRLKSNGIIVFIGHNPKNVHKNIEQVISTSAITPQAPGYKEFEQARRYGCRMLTYYQSLGQITHDYRLFCVAGAHGKSTTTALLSLVLIRAKRDPTVIIGTKLREFKDLNFRLGKSKDFILESDEHNAAFLNYSPFAAIVTNIDREHLDFYENLPAIKKSFLGFISRINPGGIAVLNGDDKNLKSLKSRIQKTAAAANIRVCWYSSKNNRTAAKKIKKILRVPGEHNVANALGVYTLARALDINEKVILDALHSYRGSWRRMEHRGKFPTTNIDVYDDYAHHPTEIRATLNGIAESWPHRPILCVFQPHQAERLKLLFRDFLGAFKSASALILLDLYRVPGRDAEPKENLSKKLSAAIQKYLEHPAANRHLQEVIYLSNPLQLPKIVKGALSDLQHAGQTPIIVMMGAGDIVKYTDLLIQ